MYEKNLTEDLRLRLSKKDMDLLRQIANERACSISEVIRSIIGDYRRGLQAMEILNTIVKKKQEGNGELFDGNTKADLDNLV